MVIGRPSIFDEIECFKSNLEWCAEYHKHHFKDSSFYHSNTGNLYIWGGVNTGLGGSLPDIHVLGWNVIVRTP